uniref:Uncharacterized protein n=1 Tax=Oryza punctata TaxID=4537 RepID=A0A0E0LM98_ORYPU
MDSVSSPSSPLASDHRAREGTHDRSGRSTVTTVDENSPHMFSTAKTRSKDDDYILHLPAENIDEYSSDDFEDDPTIKVNVQPFAYPPEIKEMKVSKLSKHKRQDGSRLIKTVTGIPPVPVEETKHVHYFHDTKPKNGFDCIKRKPGDTTTADLMGEGVLRHREELSICTITDMEASPFASP